MPLFFEPPEHRPPARARGPSVPSQQVLAVPGLAAVGSLATWRELLECITIDYQSASTISAVAPSRTPFERRVDDIKPSKTDLNAIIMDYFISEGYPDAARMLAKEANIRPQPDTELIHERRAIKDDIISGDIQSAIERLNDLNPEILDADPTLHFSLLRLQLIELIKVYASNNCINPAPVITFAQENLAPRAPTNPEFLEGMEKAMVLLFLLPSDNLKPDLAEQLQPRLREQIAGEVNKAILASHSQRREAKIKDLVRLRAWAEIKAREANKDIPTEIRLGLFDECSPNGRSDRIEASDGEEHESGEDEDYRVRGHSEVDSMVQ